MGDDKGAVAVNVVLATLVVMMTRVTIACIPRMRTRMSGGAEDGECHDDDCSSTPDGIDNDNDGSVSVCLCVSVSVCVCVCLGLFVSPMMMIVAVRLTVLIMI